LNTPANLTNVIQANENRNESAFLRIDTHSERTWSRDFSFSGESDKSGIENKPPDKRKNGPTILFQGQADEFETESFPEVTAKMPNISESVNFRKSEGFRGNV
jgi:hypothetical protein